MHQDLVAGLMTVGIVDLLEMIKVHHQDKKRFFGVFVLPGDMNFQLGEEMAFGIETGQSVGDGQVVELGVGHGDCDMVGQGRNDGPFML